MLRRRDSSMGKRAWSCSHERQRWHPHHPHKGQAGLQVPVTPALRGEYRYGPRVHSSQHKRSDELPVQWGSLSPDRKIHSDEDTQSPALPSTHDTMWCACLHRTHAWFSKNLSSSKENQKREEYAKNCFFLSHTAPGWMKSHSFHQDVPSHLNTSF